MGAIVGLAGAIVLVAAERPSILSGPAQRGFPSWMVGPLAHRLPSLPPSPPMLQADLTRALAILGLAWLVAVLCAPRVPAAIVWSAVVATHVTLLLGPPLSLTDVFNYLHYGRMPATYGVNPYAALPLTVRQDPAYHFSNWHHLPSPYGPLFTLVTEGLAPLSLPAAYWVWKGAAAGRRARDPRRWWPSRRAGSAAPRRPRSRSSASTRWSSSTASAARTTSRSCCCAASPRCRWRSSAGRPGPRRGGTSARAPAPSWPPGSSRRRPCSRPWSSSLAAGACPPWGVRAAPACSSSRSSGWSTPATCPRRASRTGSSAR